MATVPVPTAGRDPERRMRAGRVNVIAIALYAVLLVAVIGGDRLRRRRAVPA